MEKHTATRTAASRAPSRPGITLVELMVAMVIMSVGVLGMVGAFKYFNVGVQSAKTRSLANNIAQERVEYLKNRSYYRVLVTTQTVPADTNFTPPMVYDHAPNGEEVVNVGGLNFTRRVLIRKVNENAGGDLTYLNWNDPDTGLKEIKVIVAWYERGEWRKLEVTNLRENPARINKTSVIKGYVKDSLNVPVAGVVVRAQERPSMYGETDAAGYYNFSIEGGSYTLLAVKDGWFPGTLPQFSLAPGETSPDENFTLTQMSSGTVIGKLYVTDHLVISQIVGSTATATGNTEWVEVYNPTTWTWTMATGLGTGANELVRFAYKESAAVLILPDIDYRAVSLAPNGYFIFANTGTVTAAGVTLQADAVYDRDSNWANQDDVILTGSPSPAGYVVLRGAAASPVYDTLGWNASNNGIGGKQLAESFEGEAIAQSIGFEPGEAYTRKTTSSGVTPGLGRCYDSNDNNDDFAGARPFSSLPHNSAQTEACNSGTPAAGALVFADDGLSTPVSADSGGNFNLTNVSTGAWTVYASTGLSFSSVTVDGGVSNGFVVNAGDIRLSTETIYGYVTGLVLNTAGTALPGIKMFSAGSEQVNTNSSGRYTLPVATGVITVVANYQSQSPSYVELSSMGVSVELGEVAQGVDFTLYYGGRISGRVTTNGVDPLPGIPVVGIKDDVEQGNGISDDEGYFTISGSGISTGTYVVVPQLEAGEASSPSSTTVTVAAGETAFSSTFSVTGAFGYVTGSVTNGAGRPISTGVLIYVTTATLGAGSYPPDITPALRAGTGVYYAASSSALGNYNIPVKGGYTYNVYAWYTTWSGSTPSIVPKQALGVAVTPGQTVVRDFSW
ncbi:MAG: hypothetical protein CVU79_02630 [Elusimicrobia bacterium HGW-Elusimicrobia-3]|nr:MAG: hypothetical protein CVU79_02630 [Elusimicrobia bacterium HGW-Elusimicrobia-3]